jgi:pSer/pThr/pTyr-binding forkhead associated (FHA) protein
VQAQVLLGRTDRVRGEARLQADRGNYDAAAAMLRAFMMEIEAAPAYIAGDGSPLSEGYEQLVDEAMAYETRPSQEQYRNFKRSFYGVEAATGAQHGSDRRALSNKSAALMQNIVGEVPKGNIVVTDAGGNEQRIPIAAELTIGRVQGNDIALQTGMLSKRHTRLVVRDGKLIVVDLRSTNGTYVNGQRINAPQVLKSDDKIHLGDYTLSVELEDED